MGLKSTADRYGTMILSIHWVSALLIIILLVSGFRAANRADPVAKAAILKFHIPLAVGGAGLDRLADCVVVGLRPQAQARCRMPYWQERLARGVHILFYIVILGMIASGIGMVALSGAGPVIFGADGTLPDFWKYPPRVPHGIGARLLLALLVLHTGAALLSPLRSPRRLAWAHVVKSMSGGGVRRGFNHYGGCMGGKENSHKSVSACYGSFTS